jgi:hypothetical protein
MAGGWITGDEYAGGGDQADTVSWKDVCPGMGELGTLCGLSTGMIIGSETK